MWPLAVSPQRFYTNSAYLTLSRGKITRDPLTWFIKISVGVSKEFAVFRLARTYWCSRGSLGEFVGKNKRVRQETTLYDAAVCRMKSCRRVWIHPRFPWGELLKVRGNIIPLAYSAGSRRQITGIVMRELKSVRLLVMTLIIEAQADARRSV